MNAELGFKERLKMRAAHALSDTKAGSAYRRFKKFKEQRAALSNFSYSHPDQKFVERMTIRAIETLTGKPKLRRMYLEHYQSPTPGESFWAAAIRKLQLNLNFDRALWASIPQEGPLVIIANHPFGVVDGIIISYLASLVKPRFKVLTNSMLLRAEEVRPFLLPVDFSETREALETNIATRRQAIQELAEGGTVVVFPSGGVSTARPPLGKALDDEWKPFTAKLIHMSKATVVPIYFEGQNSRLFQIVSSFSVTLRMSLMFQEVANKIGRDVNISVGKPIAYEEIAHMKDRRTLIEHLRNVTYKLGETRPQ